MEWLNIPGLVLVALLLVPNIVYAAACKDGFGGNYHNKTMEGLEQLGRYGSMAAMAFYPPERPGLYLCIGGAILALYWLGWLLLWREHSMKKALVLSVLPSLLFLESGLVTRNVPLLAVGSLFGVCHIYISCKNALLGGQ